MRVLYFILAIAFLATGSLAIDCSNAKYKGKHTTCIYPNPQPAAACGKVISVGLSESEKWELVDMHNQYRAYVASGKELRGKPGPQPAASDMPVMTWDNEIAEIAQRWANQCHFGHDSMRDVDRYYVGQNVGMIMTTGTISSRPADIVKAWYEEVKDMNRNLVYRFYDDGSFHKVGHYTQLVWAKSNKLGCGKIVHQADQWAKYYVVCNYGPGGNYINQPIYPARG